METRAVELTGNDIGDAPSTTVAYLESYARKLVTASSGGSWMLLDPVLEGNPLDEVWKAVGTIKLSPIFPVLTSSAGKP